MIRLNVFAFKCSAQFFMWYEMYIISLLLCTQVMHTSPTVTGKEPTTSALNGTRLGKHSRACRDTHVTSTRHFCTALNELCCTQLVTYGQNNSMIVICRFYSDSWPKGKSNFTVLRAVLGLFCIESVLEFEKGEKGQSGSFQSLIMESSQLKL